MCAEKKKGNSNLKKKYKQRINKFKQKIRRAMNKTKQFCRRTINKMKQKVRRAINKTKQFCRRTINKTKQFCRRMKNKVKKLFRTFKRWLGSHPARMLIHKLLKPRLCDDGFFESILADIEKIPESNGSKYYVPYDIPIAIVADEFLYNSYNNIADFKFMTPENYKEICNEVKYLLIVSAWRGLNNEWRRMSTEGSDTNKVIHDAIEYYKKNNKKVIFYSKEDPPNYEVFLPIARKCDVIFTSAAEMVEKYKQDCQNDNVHVMKFGINPVYHNPVGTQIKKRKNEVIFSGSWMKKYPNRIKEQDMIFKGVLKAGYTLKLIDRNYHLDNWGFFFPLRYYKYISPSIEHEYLQKVHKLYDWAINMNSVQESETMFANRVYELQANANLLISNESIGVRTQFPDVKIVHSENGVKEYLSQFSDEDVYRSQMAGVRSVMTDETTFDRVGELLNICGEEVSQPERRIVVLVDVITEELQKCFDMQTYRNKKLIAMSDAASVVEEYDMIAVWHENSKYEECYLEDMVNAFKYTNCDYVTKNAYKIGDGYVEGIEHNYTDKINNLYATVFWNEEGTYEKILEYVSRPQETYLLENGYSVDHFGYIKLS